MAGRPSIYTEELATQICERLALGESLRRICRRDDVPDISTVIRWVIDPEHPFRAQYVQAREAQAEMMADDLTDIADDGTNDYMLKESKDGEGFYAVDHEHIQRSKLRVDTRKWIASRLLSKRFGDKMAHTGPEGGPVKLTFSGTDEKL